MHSAELQSMQYFVICGVINVIVGITISFRFSESAKLPVSLVKVAWQLQHLMLRHSLDVVSKR